MNSESEQIPSDPSPELEGGQESGRELRTPAKITFGGACVSGLRVALAMGTFVGLLEAAWKMYWVGAPYGQSGDWPWLMLAGACGRLVLTHALFWTLLGLVYCLPLSWWLARRGRKSSRKRPEGVYLALCILLAGILCIPAGLDIAGMASIFSVSALVGAAGVVGLVTLLAFLWGPNSRPVRWCANTLCWSPGPCLVLIALGAGAMYATPLRGVGSFRVAPAGKKLPQRSEGPPNILWIVLDTVRADRLSCYGYDRPTTPFLDRFSASAMVYERAVAGAYWTIPTHASMFTGLPTRAHGATHESAWLGDEHWTIAELLGEQGYQCALFSNNPYIAKEHNFTQGFEHTPRCSLLNRLHGMTLWRWCEWLGLGPIVPWLEGDAGAALTNAEIAAWLDRAYDPTRPFMLFVNYMETHMPYQAPRTIRKMFMDAAETARSYVLPRRAYGDIFKALLVRYNLLDPTEVSEQDREILAAHYDASLRYLDGRIEELMSVFEQRGLGDNTVVVITSDHGESLGEHRNWGHQFGVYDTLIRVPLIIRFPGGQPAGRARTVVQTTDLFATLIRRAGVRLPDTKGLQLWDLIHQNGQLAQERMAVSECLTTDPRPFFLAGDLDPDFNAQPFTRKLVAATQGHYKYILSSDGQNELYDLAADPGETNNIIDAEPWVAGRLSDKLKRWIETVPKYAYPQGKKKSDLPADLARQLRALGYLQ